MYSREFMKFLFGYQKDDFKQSAPETKQIKLKTGSKRKKLAEVFVLKDK